MLMLIMLITCKHNVSNGVLIGDVPGVKIRGFPLPPDRCPVPTTLPRILEARHMLHF